MSLLAESDISVTQAGLEVGFRDLRTFERAFERCAGMCPSAFKRSVRPS